jgi:extracellular elastinolytic metalloproteinase
MGDAAPKDADLGVVDHLDESNCAWVDLPYSMAAEYPAEQGDSRHALLQFMVAALPDPDLANDILTRRDEYLAGLTSEFDVHLVGHHGIVIETVSNVPGTVNPVKSKMAYIQVPDGDRTELQLVWKARLFSSFRSLISC